MNQNSSINKFLEYNFGKKIVVIQGLGFVGAVMAIVCANASEEYAVIGVDLPNDLGLDRINKLNSGVFPITASDPKIEQYFQKAIKKKNFLATSSEYAYSIANYVIVDINLDVQKNTDTLGESFNSFEVDMSAFEKAIKVIGKNIQEETVVIIETTVPPGTCQNYVAPIINKEFKRRGLKGEKVYIGHSYERVMPGPGYIDSIINFYRVYSGINEVSANEVDKFLKTIISTKDYPLTRLHNTTATETAKVLENSYRAMNIAFMVEWSRFAENSGINLYEIVNAIRLRPTHSNMMLPGIGVGGYCLTKDPLLASWASQTQTKENLKLEESEKAVKINDSMPKQAFEFIQKQYEDPLKDVKTLILGISYRGNVGDTRYSPVEVLYKLLLDEGAKIKFTDPYLDYWEEIDSKVPKVITSKLIEESELIIFASFHTDYKTDETLYKTLNNTEGKYIIDTLGLLSEKQISILRQKHTVKVLGRGNL